jgi:hypothetical protein
MKHQVIVAAAAALCSTTRCAVQRLDTARTAIYNHFQSSQRCQTHFFAKSNEPAYVAYYNSMYLLQDTTETLFVHRAKDFSPLPMEAYLEFWGVMQALIIQQDSICELYHSIFGVQPSKVGFNSWPRIRELRNLCAGHPARKTHGSPLTRSFMGRNFGNYAQISYEQWAQGSGQSHHSVALGQIVDGYIPEAEGLLKLVLGEMQRQWP